MSEFKRLENEQFKDYFVRIASMYKEFGWSKIGDVLNQMSGESDAYDTWRKRYQKELNDEYKSGCKLPKDIDFIRDDVIQTDTSVIDQKLLELQKERIKLQTEKLEWNKWIREHSRDEMILDKIKECVSEACPFEQIKYIKPEHGDKEYLLCLADAHYGIEFEIKDFEGNIINEYSPGIFQRRMVQLFYHLMDFIEKEQVKEINIWDLGDGIQGILRLNSQLMKLKYGIIESSILYADYIANWLQTLSNYVRINYQMVKDSNHNQLRICGTQKNAFADENMSKVMIALIKQRLSENPNVKIIENPTGYCYQKILGQYGVVGPHGEMKNFNSSLNDFSRLYNTKLNYVFTGHGHHKKSEEVGQDAEVIMVQSIIGLDPYGESLLKSSNAGASLFTFEEEKGIVNEHRFKFNK